MKSLYVTVTGFPVPIATVIFPPQVEYEFISEEEQDNGTWVLHFRWDGTSQVAVEQMLNISDLVVSYQIL